MITKIKKWFENKFNKEQRANRLNNRLLYTDDFGLYHKDEINGVQCKKYVILYMRLTNKG